MKARTTLENGGATSPHPRHHYVLTGSILLLMLTLVVSYFFYQVNLNLLWPPGTTSLWSENNTKDDDAQEDQRSPLPALNHTLHTPHAPQLDVKEMATPLDDGNNSKKPSNNQKSNSSLFPAVAWLMSFPNSGTSYTITNVQRISNRTTATNYAAGFGQLVPVRPEYKQGPFLHNPSMQLPDHYVLTKTHCGGYCSACHPRKYLTMNTPSTFTTFCGRGEITIDHRAVQTQYDPYAVPQRAVHLIRNPFDNVVSRMHLAVRQLRRKGWSEDQLANYTDDRAGLLAWCEYLHQKNAKVKQWMFPSFLKKLIQDVPCYDEWIQYTMWHSLALNVTEELKIPVHYLYYEDYQPDRYQATMASLLDFLQLEAVQAPIPFEEGKTYGHFYTDAEARAAWQLVQTLASPAAWLRLQGYFIPWMLLLPPSETSHANATATNHTSS